jgi:serine/threonine protein kinase
VENRYKIVERIDSGGMAEVFKGRARAIHGIEKTVAIKRILPHLARNRKFVAMFLDEARLSVYLNHANIVQVFDIARAGEDYFIVMEYVEGANLRTLLDASRNANRPLPVEGAAFIAAEVCRGLAYAHARRDNDGRPLNIVHRDVSPPNILLSLEGEVKLVDFGLAKAASQLERSDPDILKGKLGYMSPEQAHGMPFDQRADVFATGILLWEMLAGRRLFRGETDLETLEQVRAARVQPLREINPRVPKDLEEVVSRALARDAARRYQSARQLGDDLWTMLFRNRLRVTAHDVAVLVREVASALPPAESTTRAIDQMIQEEIIRLISIESYELPEDSPPPSLDAEGSRPIQVEDLSLVRERRPPGRAPVALGGGTGAAAQKAPAADFVPLTELLEPEPDAERAPRASPAPAPAAPRAPVRAGPTRRSGRAAWWLLALLVLAGVGGGLFFLFTGNDAPAPAGQQTSKRR